jgi:hypothetical protein
MNHMSTTEEVKTVKRVRNYLTQNGLPVTQSNCSQFSWGDNFFYLNALLLLPVMVDLPKDSLGIHITELVSFFAVPGLLWLITRHTWPGFALNMRINLTLSAIFLPIILIIAALQEVNSHASHQNLPGHLSQPHLTHLFVPDLLGFGVAEFAIFYIFNKKVSMSNPGPSKKRTTWFWAIATVLLAYGATAWVILCIYASR